MSFYSIPPWFIPLFELNKCFQSRILELYSVFCYMISSDLIPKILLKIPNVYNYLYHIHGEWLTIYHVFPDDVYIIGKLYTEIHYSIIIQYPKQLQIPQITHKIHAKSWEICIINNTS